MNKSVIKQSVIVLFSSLLVACAASSEAPDEATYAAEPASRDCISQSTIRDYQVLDDNNLIVTGAVKRKYHVELSQRIFGLQSSWSIGFRSPTGMICPGSAEVIADGGFGPDRFRIRSIRRLSSQELDELLVRFGKKEPEIEQTPATAEVKGAEVEELD